jgi:hypothetical protein
MGGETWSAEDGVTLIQMGFPVVCGSQLIPCLLESFRIRNELLTIPSTDERLILRPWISNFRKAQEV